MSRPPAAARPAYKLDAVSAELSDRLDRGEARRLVRS